MAEGDEGISAASTTKRGGYLVPKMNFRWQKKERGSRIETDCDM